MIKKLRLKFILINMTFVCTILLVVLGTLYCSNASRSKKQETELLTSILNDDKDMKPHKIMPENPGTAKRDLPNFAIPSLILFVDSDRHVNNTVERELSVSDDTAALLVDEILGSSNTSGVLRDYALKYQYKPVDNGWKIVFIDYSFSQSNLFHLLLTCVLIFFGGSIAFFFLSLYLSKWATLPIEKAWEQQNQFIADASHELKTPLTVILANLGILAAHPSSTLREQSRWLDNTKDEAKRMKQLVESLLFLARADASQTPMLLSEVDFSDLLWSRILPFESVAFEKGITLDSTIQPELTVIGDEGQLKQLVAILLDNACKYAGKNGKIRVSASKDSEHIVLKVTNTGSVIAPDEIPHLFERFYRTDKSRARTEGGYGLGLAIAKNIVESHHGKISAASSAESGTSFTIQLKHKATP